MDSRNRRPLLLLAFAIVVALVILYLGSQGIIGPTT